MDINREMYLSMCDFHLCRGVCLVHKISGNAQICGDFCDRYEYFLTDYES